ncbi:DNA recombination protein RmuC [Sulfurivirga caldicuralii]|uniref:DNA recombination protein RmuC n=1 Tax=Sulfurivirga caldicuralii TaxID=364032 RepID=A0A1N6DDT0_9GAMM|nr:DNA recombination protein RmuC [Sulfurivirga caldicuralii]SIN68970.1 DNA recombination protein RmuC [Sulfurivirga caldicuralii]
MPELIALVAIVIVMAAVVGLSLWRFEKRRADTLAARLAEAEPALQHTRDELIETRSHLDHAREESARLQREIEDLRAQLASANGRLQQQAALQGRMEGLEQTLVQTRTQLQTLEQDKAALQRELNALSAQRAELETRLEEQTRQHAEQIRLLEDAKKQLASEFENLSNRLFEQKQQQFSTTSRQQLEAVMQPWREQLEQFRKRLDEMHTQQHSSLGKLKGELNTLKALNESLSKEAQTLSEALRGESKTQGNWGELQLERLLQAAGLREGEEYVREASFSTETGRQRPDVLINLPDGKHIVVDAKVSLTAYTRALEADDEAARKAAIKAHVDSVKKHVDELGGKQYHLIDELNAPEFTLMFMPIEGAYVMALEADPHLQEYAYRQNVAIVTAPTLLVTLKTVGHLWKLAHQDRRMLELMDEAGKLHDKFVDFIKDFDAIRQRLDQAQKAWQAADTKLQSGTGHIVRRIEKIGALSARVRKQLPESRSSLAQSEASAGELSSE